MKSVKAQTVVSSSIAVLLKHAVTGKSTSIQTLSKSVWTSFFNICDAVEANDTMRKMVLDYIANGQLSKGRLTKLRKFLREQAGIGPVPDIEDLSEQITIILSEESNFLPKSLEGLAKIVDAFVDAFIQMYDYNTDDAAVTGGVAVKTRRLRKRSEDAEPWEEEEETYDQNKKYIHILHSISSHIDSYVRFLDARANRAQLDDEKQAEILAWELSRGRWQPFRQMALSLKRIRLSGSLVTFIQDLNYDIASDMQNSIESMDAYSILFDDHIEKKKQKPSS